MAVRRQGVLVFMLPTRCVPCLPSGLMQNDVFWLMLRVHDGNELNTNGLYGE
jgi:hypothetical protein